MFSDLRDVSVIGVALTIMVILLLGVALIAASIAEKRNALAVKLEEKIIDRYIATGKVCTHVHPL